MNDAHCASAARRPRAKAARRRATGDARRRRRARRARSGRRATTRRPRASSTANGTPGVDLGTRRPAVRRRRPGMRRHDVPEEDALARPSSASTRWTIVAVASAGPGAGELALGGERDARDPRAAVAGRLADQQPRAPPRAPRDSLEPVAPERGAGAVPVEVRRSRRSGPRRVCSMNERIEITTLTDGGQQPPRCRAAESPRSSTSAKTLARPRPVRLQPRSRRRGDRRRRDSRAPPRAASRSGSPTTSTTRTRFRCRRRRNRTRS